MGFLKMASLSKQESIIVTQWISLEGTTKTRLNTGGVC